MRKEIPSAFALIADKLCKALCAVNPHLGDVES